MTRLQTDYLDIYYAHEDDEKTPLEETLGAFNELVVSGKVRYIAASQYSGPRLSEALAVSEVNGFASYIAIQNQYNILEREPFETDMRPVLETNGMSAIPFFGLARGFLSGKYRAGVPVDSVRAGGVVDYQNERGWKIVAALKEIAKVHNSSIAAIALAWLRAQRNVSVPISSARTPEQLVELMKIVELSPEEIVTIDLLSGTAN